MMIDPQTRSLTDAGFNLADKIDEWLDGHAGLHAPSTIARGVKANTVEVWQVLQWLEREVMVDADGNGRLRKYGARMSHCYAR
ncbi:hypothetical protein I5G80_gp065 [Mycobacterium phage Krueger]|uniref:Uncharacterized protein n=1 Tax=Mycobacterium phage Krueger TaxID=2015820 RepID=A0A222ZMG6_9CAUD|nr:hypothetical protein I5G80_gp065 [Mycobacterium phage Krueger]ASR85579.1 hypothetical protein SEA_KRUEGER_81 [Mycobacterium phage Krueger]